MSKTRSQRDEILASLKGGFPSKRDCSMIATGGRQERWVQQPKGRQHG